MKTLALIITSDQYPQYIAPMVRAAHAKGLEVRLHLTGAGVRMISSLDLEALTVLARITICRKSARSLGIATPHKTGYGPMLVRADEMVRVVNESDRHVIL